MVPTYLDNHSFCISACLQIQWIVRDELDATRDQVPFHSHQRCGLGAAMDFNVLSLRSDFYGWWWIW